MHIAYATTHDPADERIWSGVSSSILKALRQSGVKTDVTGPITATASLPDRIKGKACRVLTRKEHVSHFELNFAKSLSQLTDDKMRHLPSLDAIVSPGVMPIPVAYLKNKAPLILWLDSTFASLHSSYSWYENLCEDSVRMANDHQQQLLDRADLIFFSSNWAKECAARDYNVDTNKLHIAYFGSGVESQTQTQIDSTISKRDLKVCKLLFLGVEWERKGASIACGILRSLQNMGVEAQLTIVGCKPPGDFSLPDNCKIQPFISRSDENGSKAYTDLLSSSHFLLLPSRADCTPVVLADAAAHALPSVTTDVGGISSVISDGVSGAVFPLEATATEYAAYIRDTWTDPGAYLELCQSTYKDQVSRLNWKTSIAEVLSHIRNI